MSARISMGVITSYDVEAQRAVVQLKPTNQETGWLSCLCPALEGTECFTIPVHGSYAEGLVVPFPFQNALMGTLKAGYVDVDGLRIPYERTTVDVSESLNKEVVASITQRGVVVTGVIR